MNDMTATNENLLAAFEAQTIEPSSFGHRDHVVVAYDLLRRNDFVEAAAKYASCIRGMAEKAGAPEKFNATITLAFMSLIAERMDDGNYADFASFEKANADLASKDVLARWYSKDRLTSPRARRQFLLPDMPGRE